MGCVHGKCCTRYPSSSDGDSGRRREKRPYKCKYILTQRSLELVPVPSHNFTLQFSVFTQHGYYPDTVERENQDSFCIKTQLQGNPNIHFFGVFDGHGQYGAECSNFVKDRLVERLANDTTLLDDPLKAYNSAFLATNSELHDSEIDDTMSGTTAITVLTEPEETYGSVRTDFYDTQQSCQHSVSMNRSAAIVVPSPMMHQRPSQLDVG
ncbi:hypothetical protein GOBAR_DD07833 [Gossypium barbadense]|nr:hypothetical protein GOBAR_DD07833 [Gossypium barbadense]